MSAVAAALPAVAGAGPAGAVRREAELAAVVAAPLRADLVLQRQLFRGNAYFVIKDPLALTYFRLKEEEGFLITLLDGKRTMAEILRLFRERFPNQELSVTDVAAFTNQMSSAGLLNINARRFVDVARAQQSVPQSWLMFWGKLLSKMLFLQIPLVDPSRWLGKLTHAIRFVWTRWFIGICLAFIAWSAFWLIVNRDAFAQNTVNFFSPGNLFLIWVTIIIVKTLHEFGHATTCRHFGGEVHEMGVCLICFAPAGYVDASDAWMMRRKAHKLYTTIAGIFTEFVLAGIAAHLWLYLPPGLAKNLAFNAMIVASVNTVFFNANPLMKFDGYYVVSDLLEIPNLRAKAMAYCSYHLQRLLLGYRNLTQERTLEEESNSGVFITYAVLAYGYMVMIIYSLTQVFAHLLEPFGLRDFGLALGIFMQGSFLMFPIAKVVSDAFSAGRANTVREENVWRRLARWLLPLAALAVFVALLPSRHRVEQQAVLVAASSERAGVEIGGIVDQVHVRTGQWIEAGQPMVTLKNAEVETDVLASALAFEAAKLRLSSLQTDGTLRAGALAPSAALALESSATGRERALHAESQLVVRAPAAGFVVTPDIARVQGMYLNPGFSELRVADLRRFKLLIPLTETQAELVEPGSRVRGRDLAGARLVEGRIAVLPSHKAAWRDYHAAMLSMFGGPAPFEMQSMSEAHAPTFGLFIAEADLPEAPRGSIEGLRVKVVIDGRPATIGQRVWRWAVGLWHGRAGA